MASLNRQDIDCRANLPIIGGDGMSINTPLVLANDGGVNNYASHEHTYIRCICEARKLRNWSIKGQALLSHEGKLIDRIDISYVQWRSWKKVMVQESYYFEITDVRQRPESPKPSNQRSLGWNKYNLVERLFESEEQYLKFIKSLQKTAVTNEEGTCMAELTKNKGYFTYLLYWLGEEIYIGDYIKQFSSSEENLKIFNKGCQTLAERLTIYIDTGDIKAVPETPPAFGELTHVLKRF
jgi:hypothetical protein